jgi:hypothetical protein
LLKSYDKALKKSNNGVIMKLAAALLIVASGFCYMGTASAAGMDGSSGCGPAWYVLKVESLLSSFGRSLTNGILSPIVTLGMTFGTSNCAKHSIVLENKQSLEFISSNYEQLKVDVALGHGSYLDQFSGLMGCDGASAKVLSHTLQGHFNAIFSETGSQDASVTLDKIKGVMNAQRDLQTQCHSA